MLLFFFVAMLRVGVSVCGDSKMMKRMRDDVWTRRMKIKQEVNDVV